MKTAIYVVIATVIATLSSHDLHVLACPRLCQCQTDKNASHVTCRSKQLKNVPVGLPTNATILDLHGNQISSLTNVFHNFTEVQILDLSFNDIREVGEDVFQSMGNLQQLYLQGNQLSELPENVFQGLQQLEVLDISNNSILSLNGTVLQGLLHLHTLKLRNNLITELSGDVFLFPDCLSILDLGYNSISVIPDMSFHNLYQLQVLNLQHNSIRVLDGKSFPEFNNLTELHVSHNSLSKVVSNTSFSGILVLDLSSNNISNASHLDLTQFKDLVNLNMNGNPLVSINTPVFKQLHSLQYLSLSNMPKLNYLSKSTFEGLTNLTELNLTYNTHMSFIHKDLFQPLPHISIIDLSFSNISRLYQESFQTNTQLTELNLTGNNLTCDCGITWMLQEIENVSSSLVNREFIDCVMPNTQTSVPIMTLEADNLFCSDVQIVNYSSDSSFKIGQPAILKCVAESSPAPEIVWVTPRKRTFKYHDFHAFATLDFLPLNDSLAYLIYHHTHTPEDQPSYYSISETDPNRIMVLEDGSLYIDFVMRSDAGPYTCIAKNPSNSSQVIINVSLDYTIITQTYLWSWVVGAACAASFFVLNLTYSLTLAGIRRCISQRRRERIRQILENMDQYKTQHLARIKENYHHQVGRIRDQYHFQLGRIREHHHNQMGRMGRMREGASQKVDKLKENYNNQKGRLKEYSSEQLSQIRERYNNQIDKIKDYGSYKMDRIHKKYKLKQHHVIRLLEMMNLDNCRTVFDSECVRTESMILQSDLFTSDIPIHTPIDSASVSDSEYLTATSSESSKYNSQENIDNTHDDPENGTNSTSIHPYIPETDLDQTTNDQTETFSDARNVTPTKDDTKDDTQTSEHHGKRSSHRKHKKRIYRDPTSQITHQSTELGVNDHLSESMRTVNEWERNSEQLSPLLVMGQDEEMPATGSESSQRLLRDNGADVSHVAVDMPPVSVDDYIRETNV